MGSVNYVPGTVPVLVLFHRLCMISRNPTKTGTGRNGTGFSFSFVSLIASALGDKVTKEKFVETVQQAVQFVTTENSRKLSGKARRYMMVYKNWNPKYIDYDTIEKFVKKCKSHRSVEDQDAEYVSGAWKKV